ncbi:hypothetical protein E2C01_020112 [Portunus trituberculatus]|uniref:Uncharacterized protein n=1 Tax=Portunus trituberculatus TaxID=210409 RepID=A0A5B7DZB5_PORTR|nr:hypothetical protein [Portunus trituberculatus]
MFRIVNGIEKVDKEDLVMVTKDGRIRGHPIAPAGTLEECGKHCSVVGILGPISPPKHIFGVIT